MSDLVDLVKSIGFALLAVLFAMGVIAVGFIGMHRMFGPSEEQRATDRVPVALSSADGCTVYRFYDKSSWHYFTKCGSTVTTTKNYTESCGKGCSRARTETLTTEGNQ